MTPTKFFFLGLPDSAIVIGMYLISSTLSIIGSLVLVDVIMDLPIHVTKDMNEYPLPKFLFVLIFFIIVFLFGIIGLLNSHHAIYTQKIYSTENIDDKKIKVTINLEGIASVVEREPNYFTGVVYTQYPIFKTGTIDIFLTKEYYLLRVAPESNFFRRGTIDFGAGRHCRKLIKQELIEKIA